MAVSPFRTAGECSVPPEKNKGEEEGRVRRASGWPF